MHNELPSLSKLIKNDKKEKVICNLNKKEKCVINLENLSVKSWTKKRKNS